jgi:hypothetical protein
MGWRLSVGQGRDWVGVLEQFEGHKDKTGVEFFFIGAVLSLSGVKWDLWSVLNGTVHGMRVVKAES